MTNNKTKTTITNVTKEKKRKKKKPSGVIPKKVKKIIDVVSLYKPNRTESDYLKAIMNPFDPTVEGVRIPDRFPFPTVAYHSRSYLTLYSDSSGNLGFTWFPSPTNSFLVPVNNPASTDMTTISMANEISYFPSTDANINSLFDCFRVVAGGIMIENDMSFNQIQGRITCVPFICPDVAISQAQMSLASVNGTNVINILTNGAGLSLSSPGAFQLSIDQLITSPVMLTTRPINPDGYSFRSSCGVSDTIGNNYDIIGGTETFSGSSGLVTSGAINLGSNSKGMVGWHFYATGLPASTPVLNVQMELHLEGCKTAIGSALEPSGFRQPSPTGNIESALARLPAELARIVSPALQVGGIALGRGLLAGITSMSL